MESDIQQTHIDSDYFNSKQFKKQIAIIKQAAELAQKKVDYATAHNDHILRAIEVVQDFLRKKHRLCYGGQAINAHLPAKYKFYDPEYSIPDFDFFTPSSNSDIIMIVKDLRKAGFTDISAREGMHEGTMKIYVEYIPVADITEIDPQLYRILSKREYRVDGISYLDANSLRMLMYLELSRPQGEVKRWEKVFERLMLLNEFSPGPSCTSTRPIFHSILTKEQVQCTIDFIIKQKRVFAGADLKSFYEKVLYHKNESTQWLFTSKKPILFFSSDSKADASYLQSEFTRLQSPSIKKTFTIKTYSSKGIDLIPTITIVSQGKYPLVFIIHESECHSYLNIPINDRTVMRIASMDTLITLFFSVGLIKSSYFDMGAMECLANQMVHLNMEARKRGDTFLFPFISIKCSGHQTSMPSLIRAKVKRITAKRAELKQLMNIATKNSIRTNTRSNTRSNKNTRTKMKY